MNDSNQYKIIENPSLIPMRLSAESTRELIQAFGFLIAKQFGGKLSRAECYKDGTPVDDDAFYFRFEEHHTVIRVEPTRANAVAMAGIYRALVEPHLVFDDDAVRGRGLRLSDNAALTLLSYSLCLLYTSPSPRDRTRSRMPSSA